MGKEGSIIEHVAQNKHLLTSRLVLRLLGKIISDKLARLERTNAILVEYIKS